MLEGMFKMMCLLLNRFITSFSQILSYTPTHNNTLYKQTKISPHKPKQLTKLA